LSEIEFNHALALDDFNPASITDHLDESIITGTRECPGSDATRLGGRHRHLRNRSIASSMFTSNLRAVLDLLARHGEALPGSSQPG